MRENEIEGNMALITGGNSDNEKSFDHTGHLDRDRDKFRARTRQTRLSSRPGCELEEYLGIFNAFYADDIEVSSETMKKTSRKGNSGALSSTS
jgi:hypothetical protein